MLHKLDPKQTAGCLANSAPFCLPVHYIVVVQVNATDLIANQTKDTQTRSFDRVAGLLPEDLVMSEPKLCKETKKKCEWIR